MYLERSKRQHNYKTINKIINCIYITTCISSVASSSLRIIGGRDAAIEEYPYVVRLERMQDGKFYHVCSAATIRPRWTLSARHCTTHKEMSLVIRYGQVPSSEDNHMKGTTPVLDIVTFPDTRHEDIHYEDIVLLKTDPIQLPRYGRVSGVSVRSLLYQEVLVTGFGLTNYTTADGTKALNATLPLAKPLQLTKGLLVPCIYYLCIHRPCSRFTSVCPGDSGGPVIHASGIVAVNTRAPVILNCQMLNNVYRMSNIVEVTPCSVYLDWISITVTTGG